MIDSRPSVSRETGAAPVPAAPRAPVDVIRVVLADDHAVARAGLRAVLRGACDIDVVGEASAGDEAVKLADRLGAHVVVMDLTMAGGDGITATRAIVACGLPARVLMLTMHTEEEYLLPALEAGAAGYLVKSVADRELVEAVRAVAHGDAPYVRGSAARVLARGIVAKQQDPLRAERERFARLSDREQDVLRLTAQGYTAPEIGDRLTISPKTVDTDKQRVNDKLGLTHRSDYVRLALRLGLLEE